jgi:phosphatidylserine decarboxylase
MWLLGKLHALCDAALRYLKLIQCGQVGWLTWDRKSGDFIREQQPLYKKLKLVLLFNPVTEWVDRTQALRLWTHRKNIKAGKYVLHALELYSSRKNAKK